MREAADEVLERRGVRGRHARLTRRFQADKMAYFWPWRMAGSMGYRCRL